MHHENQRKENSAGNTVNIEELEQIALVNAIGIHGYAHEKIGEEHAKHHAGKDIDDKMHPVPAFAPGRAFHLASEFIRSRPQNQAKEQQKQQSSSGISADDVGVQLRVNSDVMFRPGQVALQPEGMKVLNEVLDIMKEYNLYLVVRGHADSGEAKTPFDSAWELSGARSAAVLRYLAEHGIKPTGMRGVAYIACCSVAQPGSMPWMWARTSCMKNCARINV